MIEARDWPGISALARAAAALNQYHQTYRNFLLILFQVGNLASLLLPPLSDLQAA
jgi:hypothetical protein